MNKYKSQLMIFCQGLLMGVQKEGSDKQQNKPMILNGIDRHDNSLKIIIEVYTNCYGFVCYKVNQGTWETWETMEQIENTFRMLSIA